MSRISRQLCDEIETPFRGKKDQSSRAVPSHRGYENRPKRNSVNRKQKVISNLVPEDPNVSRLKWKLSEIFLKKIFVDVAVNTLIRGSLVSDSLGITLLRTQTYDKICHCKSTHRCFSFRNYAKEVQTFDPKVYSFADKASLQRVDTVTCGIQVLNFTVEPQDQNTKSQSTEMSEESRKIERLQRDCTTQVDMTHKEKQALILQSILKELELHKMLLKYLDMGQKERRQFDPMRNSTKVTNVNFMGARRWSLSPTPAGDPDFYL